MPSDARCMSCGVLFEDRPGSHFEWAGRAYVFCSTCLQSGAAIGAIARDRSAGPAAPPPAPPPRPK